MKVLIPVDSKDRFKSIISSIEENKSWALVTLDGAKISSVDFYDRYEEIFCLIENMVVINSLEFVWPMQEEGIKVLIANNERSIDEIIESFLLNKLSNFPIKSS